MGRGGDRKLADALVKKLQALHPETSEHPHFFLSGTVIFRGRREVYIDNMARFKSVGTIEWLFP